MINVNAIDHINLSVSDLDRSIHFYDQVFGLQIREDRRLDERPYAIVGRAGTGFLALHESSGPAAVRGRINHWGFVVDDFDGLGERLAALGVEVLYRRDGGDGVIEYPRSRSVYIADPDGNEIELTSRFGGGLS